MNLYTSGSLEIHSIITEPISSADKDSSIKCHEIEADDTLTLYHSPLPNLYDIREYETIGVNQSWHAYFGFDVSSDEFNQLINGQEFRFTDFAFGFSYKFTKSGDKWVGNRGYIRTPLITTTKRPNMSQPTRGYMYIKDNYRNRIIIYLCTSNDINEGNPWKYFYENKLLEFVGIHNGKTAKIEQYELKNIYYLCIWCYDCVLMENNDVSIINKLEGANSSIPWQIRSEASAHEWKHSNNNCIECLKCEHKTDQVASSKGNSLTMCTPTDFVYELSDDIGYEQGTNPFEFVGNKSCYTITPRITCICFEFIMKRG